MIGFDISTSKINSLKKNKDPNQEIKTATIKNSSATFTNDANQLKKAKIFIVTVPTPIDDSKLPDLTLIKNATLLISKYLTKDSIVVYESTVYPGVTEEVCAPILEAQTKLKLNKDFYLGYSPERLSPGDDNLTLTKIIKIVSGSTPSIAKLLEKIYGSIVKAGIHVAPSIKVAEAAKVIENTQRDLNAALMNELAIIFNKMDINTTDVIDAAATKWNFYRFTPGLVGGHCIGIDPYYLTYKARELGYHPQVILSGRRINDGMGKFIAEQTVKRLIKVNKPVNKAKVLILGITFKENVSDIRNSKVIDIIKELQYYGAKPIVHDPHAKNEDTQAEYGVSLSSKLQPADAIIVAVAHDEFKNLDLDNLYKLITGTKNQKILMDVKSIYKQQPKKIKQFNYWSL